MVVTAAALVARAPAWDRMTDKIITVIEEACTKAEAAKGSDR